MSNLQLPILNPDPSTSLPWVKGLRVSGLGVLGLGFGVWGLGFGVWGLGFGV